jgi:FixJ family two-component response regulator
MLLCSAGIEAQTFESAREFINCGFREQNACLIADARMQGLELHQKLIARGIRLPVIFLTAFDSEKVRKQAKDQGGLGYFRKPVDDQALLDSIRWALSKIP